jgi:tripartite-type tricarboxylate transporter receptor subunit TctC
MKETNMKSTISTLRRALLVAACACTAFGAAHAQDYPNHPIKFIVPFSPGGSSDIVARLLAKDLEKQLGQPLVIENKPGAGAMIGLNEMVQAKPDGYTIGITNSGMVTQPLYGIAKYNYVTDLQPLAQIGEVPFVLVVKADSPWKTLGEFMAYCKANASGCNYGITGIGNTSHIGPEHLKYLAKFPMEFVNFDGGGKLMTSLLGGHIQAGGINPVDIREQVKAGKIRVLVVFGEKRLADPLFANAPTAKELGYDVVVTLWQGIGAPKGMPQPVLAKLNDAFTKVMASPDMQQQLRGLGLEPVHLGPAEFAKKWIAEQAHYKQVVTDTGIMQLVKSQTK